METSRRFRRSAVITLTITSGLAAAACCDRNTPPAERSRRSTWWRFWHNESWCGGYYHRSSGYTYIGGPRGSRGGLAGTTSRGGFGVSAHGSAGG